MNDDDVRRLRRDRKNTIKADEATAGMISWSRGLVITGKEYIAGMLVFLFESDRSGYYRLDELFPVQLPGPSPRDTVANGGLCRCDWRVIGGERDGEIHRHPPEMPWRAHSEVCPVHRLRLRLWPVGAKWVEHAELWIDGVLVDRPGTWRVDDVIVWPKDVREDFARIAQPCADMLRAAFCEPDALSDLPTQSALPRHVCEICGGPSYRCGGRLGHEGLV